MLIGVESCTSFPRPLWVLSASRAKYFSRVQLQAILNPTQFVAGKPPLAELKQAMGPTTHMAPVPRSFNVLTALREGNPLCVMWFLVYCLLHGPHCRIPGFWIPTGFSICKGGAELFWHLRVLRLSGLTTDAGNVSQHYLGLIP